MKIENLKLKILIGAAIIIGVAIFNSQNTRLGTNPVVTITPSKLKSLPENLTVEESLILHPPPKESSKSALQKHAKMVAKLALAANELEINNCEPKPVVLKVKKGEEFIIKNSDGVKHKIIIDENHNYELATNDSMTIKADFNYGTGDYGYVCEGAGLVGFLHITP